MTEQELYTYHEETFKPIYADLVAVLASKPEQIVFELEAALSHVAVAKTNPDLYDDNINKAFGHLQRAALDAAKMLWLEHRKRVNDVVLDRDIRAFAFNASEKELLEKYQQSESLAQQARKTELSNTGRNLREAIDLYYSAAESFDSILGLLDTTKVSNVAHFKKKIKTKEHFISFLIGCASSAIVAILIAIFA